MKLIKFICIFLVSITVCVFCMKTSRYENYEVPGTLVSKNMQKHNKHYYMSIQYIMHVKPNDTSKFKNYSVYVDYATYCTHSIGDKIAFSVSEDECLKDFKHSEWIEEISFTMLIMFGILSVFSFSAIMSIIIVDKNLINLHFNIT